jgi:hypothetical protein
MFPFMVSQAVPIYFCPPEFRRVGLRIGSFGQTPFPNKAESNKAETNKAETKTANRPRLGTIWKAEE